MSGNPEFSPASIALPGDKSITQRALILSALAEGDSRLRGVLPGQDPAATASVLRHLGIAVPAIPADGSDLVVSGVGLRGLTQPEEALDCRNSGTTARLILGVLAGQHLDAVVTGVTRTGASLTPWSTIPTLP